MALFKKEYCKHCGKELEFLGSYKLADGNKVCNNCTAPCTSLFLENTKRYTYEDFVKYLEYREDNRKKLEEFEPTDIFFDKIILDRVHDWAIFGNFKHVFSFEDLVEDNYDIFNLKDLVFFEELQTVKKVEDSGILKKGSVKSDHKLIIAFENSWYPYAFSGKVLKNDKVKAVTYEGLTKKHVQLEPNADISRLSIIMLGYMEENDVHVPIDLGGLLTKSVDLSPYDKYLRKLFELYGENVFKPEEYEFFLNRCARSPLVRSQIKKEYK